jgi:hypothetical protein
MSVFRCMLLQVPSPQTLHAQEAICRFDHATFRSDASMMSHEQTLATIAARSPNVIRHSMIGLPSFVATPQGLVVLLFAACMSTCTPSALVCVCRKAALHSTRGLRYYNITLRPLRSGLAKHCAKQVDPTVVVCARNTTSTTCILPPQSFPKDCLYVPSPPAHQPPLSVTHRGPPPRDASRTYAQGSCLCCVQHEPVAAHCWLCLSHSRHFTTSSMSLQ